MRFKIDQGGLFMGVKPTDNLNVNRDVSLIQNKNIDEDQNLKLKSNKKRVDSKGQSYDVALSNYSKKAQNDHKKALDIARSTPEIREDRVKELKEKIKNGTYKVDSGKVADGMLREAILEHLASSDKTTV